MVFIENEALLPPLLGEYAAGTSIPNPNTARVETSTDDVYYVAGQQEMLKIYDVNKQVVEDWAFCLNHGRGYPNYDVTDGSGATAYYYVGNTQQSFENLLSTFLVSRSLTKDQTYRAVRELLYVFHEDSYGWREAFNARPTTLSNWYEDTRIGDMHWYLAIQQAIWHYTDNSWWPSGGVWDTEAGIDKSIIDAVAKGERKSAIETYNEAQTDPNKVRTVDVRSYDVSGGFWRFGKQNAVTMRVAEKTNHVRVLKLDADQYANLSDTELAAVVEGNRSGLSDAELALNYENGPVTFTNPNTGVSEAVVFDTTDMAQPLELWESHHFTLVENKAPSGYAPVDPVSFTWGADGEVVLDENIPVTTARVVPKADINWDNYNWDPTDTEKEHWQSDTIVIFDDKPEPGTFPLSIQKTGFVSSNGTFVKRNLAGAEFTLQSVTDPSFTQTVTVVPNTPGDEDPNTPGDETPGEPGSKFKKRLAKTGVPVMGLLTLAGLMLAGGGLLKSRKYKPMH